MAKQPSTKKKQDGATKPLSVGERIVAYGIDKIMEEIADGSHYQDIADRVGVSRNGMKAWLAKHETDLYAQAREARADNLAEEIIKIADNDANEPLLVNGVPLVSDTGQPVMVVSSAGVQHAKLRVDTRKWLASKMLPKVYGDKQDINVSGSLDIAATIIAARKRTGVTNDGD